MDHLCQRCFDTLQWKIDYHKYKPLTAFSRCGDCKQKNISKAYRELCESCAGRRREVPVLKTGSGMDKIVSTVLKEEETAVVSEEITEQFELQMLMRCSKCTFDCKQYALKPATKVEKDDLSEAA